MLDSLVERLLKYAAERVPPNARLTESGRTFLRRLITSLLSQTGSTDQDLNRIADTLERLIDRAADQSTTIDADVLERVVSESSPPEVPDDEWERALTISDQIGFGSASGGPFFRSSVGDEEAEGEEWEGADAEPEMAPEESEAEDVPRMRAANGGSRPRMSEEAPPDADGESPRKAWPRLDAPEVAVEGESFDVVVGLRKDPDPDITGAAMEVPRGPYELTVHLVADGFHTEAGETWRRTLAVTADRPYPTVTFTLTPDEDSSAIRAERLVVYYAVDGQTIGQAVRAVAVVQSDAQRGEATAPEQPAGRNFTKPGTLEPVDLEVRIAYSEHRHLLLWTFSSRHDLAEMPDEPPESDIGMKPEAFSEGLIRSIEDVKKPSIARNRLRGLGRRIRNEIPDVFWRLLAAAGDRARATRGASRPTVLLLSEEPHIPWELASFEKPLLDDTAPPYLNHQVDVGRWMLDDNESDITVPRERRVGSLAAITGTYDHPRWSDLAEAKAEAQMLDDVYGAVQIDAEIDRILDLCTDNPDLPDVLHFAVHGKYAPGQPGRGLVLLDGASVHYLTDTDVLGFSLDTGPFVFLNACQVGTSNEMLGSYAGLAQAFLAAGATAVIAPLWSVNDRVARELALDFYERVASGTPAVEALRQARIHCIETAPSDMTGTKVTTPYAYLYYGHPELLFDWHLTSTH